MFRSRFLLAAVVAAVASLAAPATSQAAFYVTLSGDGINTYVINDQNSPANTGPFTDLNNASSQVNNIQVASAGASTTLYNSIDFSLTTRTNNPGTASLGNVFASTANLVNTSNAQKRITFTITSSGFTSPGQAGDTLYARTVLTSLMGLTTSNLGSGANQSQFVTTITGSGQVPNPVSTSADSFVQSGNQMWSNQVSFTRGSNYTMSSTYDLYIAANATVDFQVNSVVTAAPAPAGLIMLAGALPFAGLLRRRLRKSELATAA